MVYDAIFLSYFRRKKILVQFHEKQIKRDEVLHRAF